MINTQPSHVGPELYLQNPFTFSIQHITVTPTFTGRGHTHTHPTFTGRGHRAHTHTPYGAGISGPPGTLPRWHSHSSREANLDTGPERWRPRNGGTVGKHLSSIPGRGRAWLGAMHTAACRPEFSSASSLLTHALTHSVTTVSGLFIVSDCNFLFSQTPT